jgi:hypothetical protein
MCVDTYRFIEYRYLAMNNDYGRLTRGSLEAITRGVAEPAAHQYEDSFQLLTDKQVFIAILCMAALAVLLT